jgi:hypothetical protein
MRLFKILDIMAKKETQPKYILKSRVFGQNKKWFDTSELAHSDARVNGGAWIKLADLTQEQIHLLYSTSPSWGSKFFEVVGNVPTNPQTDNNPTEDLPKP